MAGTAAKQSKRAQKQTTKNREKKGKGPDKNATEKQGKKGNP